MKKDLNSNELVDGQEEQENTEASRRDFLKMGSMGLAGLAGAAALGVGPSEAKYLGPRHWP